MLEIFNINAYACTACLIMHSLRYNKIDPYEKSSHSFIEFENILYSYLLVRGGVVIPTYLIRWFQVISDDLGDFRWFQMISVISSDFEWFLVISDDVGWFRMISGGFEWFQVISSDFTIWNQFFHWNSKSLEITWNHLKSSEITWNHLKSSEIIRNHLKS